MLEIMLIASLLIIAFFLAILFAPQLLRKTIDFFAVGSRIYLAGLIRLILGILLLILSMQARLWGYVLTVGLILAAFGLAIFFFPLKRTKKLLHRLQNQSNLFLRILAIISIAIWAGLIYALLPVTP